MDGNLAATYSFIHAFLTKHSHRKAAQAVKKAAKEVVILKDDIDLEGPQLDEIIKEWKLNSQKRATSSRSSGSDSSGDSTSTSDSDSSSSSDSVPDVETGKGKQVKKTTKKSTKLSKSAASPSSDADPGVSKHIVSKKASKKSLSSSPSESGSESDDESSDSSSSYKAKKGPEKKSTEPIKFTATKKVERDSSRTLSSHSGSGLDQKFTKMAKPAKKSSSGSSSSSDSSENEKAAKIPAKKMDVSSSSDSDSDSDVPSPILKETVVPGTKAKTGQNTDSSDSDSSSDEETKPPVPSPEESVSSEDVSERQATKKRRTDLEGTSVVTSTTNTPQEEESGRQSLARLKVNSAKSGRAVGERFQRVDPAKVELLMDNGYVAKHAPTNDYGKRAHEDLIVTRGAGFRKEKNKKKKGSYRGGVITMQSHSFKFT